MAGGRCMLALFTLLYGYEAMFTFIGVKAMAPHFLDLQTITAGGESHALGFDLLLAQPEN